MTVVVFLYKVLEVTVKRLAPNFLPETKTIAYRKAEKRKEDEKHIHNM